MASLLAARRQHLAAALGLHANAEAVRLGASAASRLKCALWQNNPPLLRAIGNTQSQCGLFHPQRQNSPLAFSAADSEFSSVFDPCAQGQETLGIGDRRERNCPFATRKCSCPVTASGFERIRLPAISAVATAARLALPIRKPPEVLRVFACRSCHAEESARCASRCELSIRPAQVVPARKADKSGPQSRL